MDPKDAMALFFYARALFDNGNLGAAQEYFREILLQLPEDPEIHEFYARVLGRDQQLFLAYLHMAYAGLYAGDRTRATKNYDQAKTLAHAPSELERLKRFEDIRKERREILSK
jgi:predicted Zn-dependent protease